MTRLVAIDVSSRGAHFVALESTLRRASVVAVDSVRRGDDEAASDFWERVLARLPSDIDSVLVLAPGSSISTRILDFPFGDARKVDQTLEFELETQIPYDVADVATTAHVTERGKTRTRALAALTPKTQLRAFMQELQLAGLEPRAVLVPGAALPELCNSASADPVAVVAIGARETHVSIALGTQLKFTRTLRLGGEQVDRALAQAMRVDVDDARRWKETEGRVWDSDETVPSTEVARHEAIAHGLGSLVSQLAATFKSLPSDLMPAHVLLTGGASRLPGLDRLLAHRLGIGVELLDLKSCLGDVSCELPLGPEYAPALGLGLAGARRGSGLPLNLRRGEFAYSGDMQVYRGELTRVGIGLAVIMLLAVLGSVVRYAMITGEEAELDQGICQATKKIVGREVCDPVAAKSIINSAPGADDGVFIPDYDAAVLFEMVSRAIPTDADVAFSSLDFKLEGASGQPDRIEGKGEADSFESTELVVSALRKDPCVVEAEVSKQKRGASNRVEFSLRVDVRCPPGRIPGAELGPVAVLESTVPSAAPGTPPLEGGALPPTFAPGVGPTPAPGEEGAGRVPPFASPASPFRSGLRLPSGPVLPPDVRDASPALPEGAAERYRERLRAREEAMREAVESSETRRGVEGRGDLRAPMAPRRVPRPGRGEKAEEQ